jgi:hypothetical protein
MAFTKKRINVTFEMDGAQANTQSGKRVSCRIVNAGSPSMGTADIAIYGMTLSDMNALSTIGTQFNQIGKNRVSIYAGDSDQSMKLAFQGTIYMAWMDGQAQPEVPFRVNAYGGLYEAVAKADPTSVQGTADVAQVIQQIAQQAGLQFENNGVNVKLSNPYLPGTAREQILNIARAAGIEWTIENGTVAIWDSAKGRQGRNVTLSPETGLVGYPSFNQAAIIARSVYNPEIVLGSQVTIQSQIKPASGTWNVVNVVHEIESEMPNGAWFTVVTMTTVGGDVSAGGAGD